MISINSTFILGIFILSLYGMYVLYEPFLLTISVSILLAISTYGLKILPLQKTNDMANALISTFILSALFLAPLSYFIIKIIPLISSVEMDMLKNIKPNLLKLIDELPTSLNFIKEKLSVFVSELNLQQTLKNTLGTLQNITTHSANFIKDIFLIIIFYFFILFYSKDITTYFKKVLPVSAIDVRILANNIAKNMSAVFYSIVLLASLQGLAFGSMVVFLDYDFVLFSILYAFASLIPIVGGAIMWAPLSFFEYVNGNYEKAIFIALYSILVISVIIDTILKPMFINFINKKFIKNKAVINEMLIFFSIISGLSVFGFWGMIIGPAITIFFILFIKIFIRKK